MNSASEAPQPMGDDPNKKPKGWEVQNKRRRDFYATALPHILELWRSGLTLGEVKDKLNAGKDPWSRGARGRPWTVPNLAIMLKARMDPAEYEELAANGRRRGIVAASKDAKDHNAAIKPLIRALRAEGNSQATTARLLNEAGYRNSRGELWTRERVASLEQNEPDPTENLKPPPRGQIQARPFRERNREVVSIAVVWWRDGMSMAAVKNRLNDEKLFNSVGKSWTEPHLANVFAKTLTAAEYAEAKESHDRAVSRLEERTANRIRELKPTMGWPTIAAQLEKEKVLTALGRTYTAEKAARLYRKFHDGATIGKPALVLEDGKPALVLGLDGKYRDKTLTSKAQRKVVKAMNEAGVDGLGFAQLQKVTGDARGVIRRLMEDPEWAAVIYPAENGVGWRFGPPRLINVE